MTTPVPIRIADPFADPSSEDYDADYYGHAPDEDEVADLRRSLRTAGPYRGAAIEGRLYEMGEG
jgi:hypothetical protein